MSVFYQVPGIKDNSRVVVHQQGSKAKKSLLLCGSVFNRDGGRMIQILEEEEHRHLEPEEPLAKTQVAPHFDCHHPHPEQRTFQNPATKVSAFSKKISTGKTFLKTQIKFQLHEQRFWLLLLWHSLQQEGELISKVGERPATRRRRCGVSFQSRIQLTGICVHHLPQPFLQSPLQWIPSWILFCLLWHFYSSISPVWLGRKKP